MQAQGSADLKPSPTPSYHGAIESPESHPGALRAWYFLVVLSVQRQARLRQMVWIALALLVLMSTVVGLVTLGNRWDIVRNLPWRMPRVTITRTVTRTFTEDQPGASDNLRPDERDPFGNPRPLGPTFTRGQIIGGLELLPLVTTRLAGPMLTGSPVLPAITALETAAASADNAALNRAPFGIFSNWVVFSIFLGFLLPIWSLSFATEAVGGERESRTLVWLLTRPLPRWSIYLAKFVAVLPWCLALNLGGFAILCLLGSEPGRLALRLFWPAVLGGTLAFCSLFHLMSALFRRAAVLSLVYAFFLEWVLGNMPGTMKRISISFYARCLMFEAGEPYGLQPDRPAIYLPVSGATAWVVLLGMTVAFLLMGMVVFSRSEYQDLA